ncbi:hypothetical protein WMY93_009933 [Mugilogobius chulae]|uniref:Uncharacterized protein n=1 Tax=Mugilogobius chulae TaxID=88201 RepID=A0AAW0PET0_9GOBI
MRTWRANARSSSGQRENEVWTSVRGATYTRPQACSYFRGSDCLRHFAKMCGAKNPESLTSTKLRKQTATLSQVLNLSNTELDQLADFLGHDGLDDITIDPEDHALQDSEDENQNIEVELDTEMPDETNETSQPVTIETSNHPSLQAVQRPSRKRPSRTPTSARRTVIKRTWNQREVKAVEKHLMHFINSCRVPGKADCDKCLRLEKVALKRRDWETQRQQLQSFLSPRFQCVITTLSAKQLARRGSAPLAHACGLFGA